MNDWVVPNWPAPAQVHALVTTRNGGLSAAPWHSMNLATHVGDAPRSIEQNRKRLQQHLVLHQGAVHPIQWLDQVHGTAVVEATSPTISARHNQQPVKADAIITQQRRQPIAVLTADCLPVFFCDQQGTQIAVAHAGWRGLSAGILEQTAARFACSTTQIMVWFGPAIGPNQFEVGDEVRSQMMAESPANAPLDAFFTPVNKRAGHWLADLYAIARAKLSALGIEHIYGGDLCTVEQPEQFYSYRRDGQTGRMASVMVLSSPES
ncbi:MAG: peptidoglycan editing factor PgeF [Pseudomonadales bacterium]|nr:peptidoglycan editing factor PgeF [Pseudomonadales bacterium]